MKKFIIYTYPFDFNIGGVKVLHKLCDLLNKNGQDAYLYPIPFPGQTERYFILNKSYNTPIVTNEILRDKDNYVVVYPEIIKHNPLNAKNVVRWVLNSTLEFESTYNVTDMIFYYSKIFYSEKLKNKDNILEVCEFHSDIFTNLNLERTIDCYLVRKCPNPKFIHPEKAYPISWNDCGDLVKLVNVFNNSKYLYCYDDITFVPVQAAMCGCIPIIIPYRYDKVEWKDKTSEIMNTGVAYGNTPEEIEYAKNTNIELIKLIKNKETDMTQLNRFISICQK